MIKLIISKIYLDWLFRIASKHAKKSAAEKIENCKRRCILDDRKCHFMKIFYRIFFIDTGQYFLRKSIKLRPTTNNVGNMNYQKPIHVAACFKMRPNVAPNFFYDLNCFSYALVTILQIYLLLILVLLIFLFSENGENWWKKKF